MILTPVDYGIRWRQSSSPTAGKQWSENRGHKKDRYCWGLTQARAKEIAATLKQHRDIHRVEVVARMSNSIILPLAQLVTLRRQALVKEGGGRWNYSGKMRPCQM